LLSVNGPLYTWLGFNIDLLLGKVSVPLEKILELHAQLALALTEDKLPPKYLARQNNFNVSGPGTSGDKRFVCSY